MYVWILKRKSTAMHVDFYLELVYVGGGLLLLCTCLFVLQTKTGSIFCYDCRMILVLGLVSSSTGLFVHKIQVRDKGQKKFEFHEYNQ